MTDPYRGWGPALAAGGGGRWASADAHAVHLWSADRYERSVELPGVLGGGQPRFLPGGGLLCGRFAIDPATGAAEERLPLALLASAYDPAADVARITARSVAWTRDGACALVDVEHLARRDRGAEDRAAPGSLLARVAPDGTPVQVLEDGGLGRPAVAADRWLCAGDGSLRVFDPASADLVAEVPTGGRVTALTTLGDRVVAGLAGGQVMAVDVPTGAEPQTWLRHGAVVDAVALSPDGGRVASGDREGHLEVWHLDGGRRLLETSVPGRVDGICFLSPDRLVVAVGGPERQLRHLSLTDLG